MALCSARLLLKAEEAAPELRTFLDRSFGTFVGDGLFGVDVIDFKLFCSSIGAEELLLFNLCF